jgi:spore germination cell wall hydrolase CwlJ-like protein
MLKAATCRAALIVAIGVAALQGCTGHPPGGVPEASNANSRPAAARVRTVSSERDCLVRAMYFESNRSSRDGLMAVGTVVMNRVGSSAYPNTICGVVGQPGQFAAGVLTRPLNARELPPVERAADAVLRGERYAPVGSAMHFHVAGLNIPYRVRYVTVAGGNAFYLKTGGRAGPAKSRTEVATASNTSQPTLASAAPQPGLIDRLYASLTSAPSATPAGCQTATSAFGATPLTCEEASAAR